jgi:hypothetical protein
MLLGRSEAAASGVAGRWGCFLRVTERDGRTFAQTADFSVFRIDVVVRRGTITGVGIG